MDNDPFGGYYPPQNPTSQFLNAPGMAMAGSALNNMAQMRRGMAPRENPFQVLQEQQRRNAILQNQRFQQIEVNNQRKQAAARASELHPLQVQAAEQTVVKGEQSLNPFYDFEAARDRGYIPQDMTYKQFLAFGVKPESLTANTKDFNKWLELNPNASSEDQRKAHAAIIARPTIYDTGGGGKGLYNALLGTNETLVSGEDAGAADAATAAGVDAAKQGVAVSGDLFTQFGKVGQSIGNLDQAIAAVDSGADTGVIASRFPSMTQASIELDNIRNQMGLDIVGAGSFGALSESELSFALDTAMPENLDGPELRDWLVRKKAAQTKLRLELLESSVFLNSGNTIGDLLKMKQSEEDLGSTDGY